MKMNTCLPADDGAYRRVRQREICAHLELA